MANSPGSPIKESLLLVFVALSILLIVLIWVEGMQSQQPVSLEGLGSTLSAPTQTQTQQPGLVSPDESAPALQETSAPPPAATVTPTLDISAVETSDAGVNDNLLDK